MGEGWGGEGRPVTARSDKLVTALKIMKANLSMSRKGGTREERGQT